jgi:hypothetical protein
MQNIFSQVCLQNGTARVVCFQRKNLDPSRCRFGCQITNTHCLANGKHHLDSICSFTYDNKN